MFGQSFDVVFSLLAALLVALQSSRATRTLALAFFNSVALFCIFLWKPSLALVLLGLAFVHFGVLKWKRIHVLVPLLLAIDGLTLIFFNYPLWKMQVMDRHSEVLKIVGFGFVVLRLISVSVDVRAGKGPKQLSIGLLFNYLFFFPSYLNGPVMSYEDFASQASTPQALTAERVYNALIRLVYGLAKLQLLAFVLGIFSIHAIDPNAVAQFKPHLVALSVICYGLWLYFSLSGMTDIAIGLSLIIGIRLPENFNSPFRATNLADFWRRWHISLLEWIRTYLFMPLLTLFGSIFKGCPRFNTCLAVFLSFLVLGVWHGENRRFAVYGIYHAIGMCAFTAYTFFGRSRVQSFFSGNRWLRLTGVGCAWAMNWTFIGVGWIIFAGKGELLWRLLGG